MISDMKCYKKIETKIEKKLICLPDSRRQMQAVNFGYPVLCIDLWALSVILSNYCEWNLNQFKRIRQTDGNLNE